MGHPGRGLRLGQDMARASLAWALLRTLTATVRSSTSSVARQTTDMPTLAQWLQESVRPASSTRRFFRDLARADNRPLWT
jgi:hypothetical protein